jgi:uncharacterized membrane protein YphA (DoxX/SURF4 family)
MKRPLNILLWCVQAFLAFLFVNAGWPKLAGRGDMIELFTVVGFGQWLRYLTALLELGGALLILVPRTSWIGATMLATVMVGASIAHIFILHVPVTTPAVVLLMTAFVVWGRGRPSPTSRG